MAVFISLLIVIVCFLAKAVLEAFNIGEVWDTNVEEYVRSTGVQEVHDQLKRTGRLGITLTLFFLIDKFWLPWLNIKHVVLGYQTKNRDWEKTNPTIRAAVVIGWFLTLYGFLVSYGAGI